MTVGASIQDKRVVPPLQAEGAAFPSAAEGERKQVSVLFADLTGFTALSEKLDPEDTRQIMGTVFARAAEIVARYEGRGI